MLAKFACDPISSKGRLHPETSLLPGQSPFEIDRLRIIESTAFRRLEHKTQVFISNMGDHYRNRLTHSLEVAQIARIISNSLNISADLAENISLAHDMGHSAFGHAGEDELNDIMKEYSLEFDHNAHAIKILTKLETKYPKFDGLNLSWETLEGVAKHNGPLHNLHPTNSILLYNNLQSNLDLTRYSSLEAQVAAISDDIAYNNHDIDDGFRAGLITLDELREISKLGKIIDEVKSGNPGVTNDKIIYESIQKIRNYMIIDLIENTRINIKKFSIETCEDIRNHHLPLACFSESMEIYHKEIKKFLYNRVYNSTNLVRVREKGKKVIHKLFSRYMNNPNSLPEQWKASINSSNEKERAIIIADFIACMSDRYAIDAYKLI
jgi:dGTPase